MKKVDTQSTIIANFGTLGLRKLAAHLMKVIPFAPKNTFCHRTIGRALAAIYACPIG